MEADTYGGVETAGDRGDRMWAKLWQLEKGGGQNKKGRERERERERKKERREDGEREKEGMEGVNVS